MMRMARRDRHADMSNVEGEGFSRSLQWLLVELIFTPQNASLVMAKQALWRPNRLVVTRSVSRLKTRTAAVGRGPGKLTVKPKPPMGQDSGTCFPFSPGDGANLQLCNVSSGALDDAWTAALGNSVA